MEVGNMMLSSDKLFNGWTTMKLGFLLLSFMLLGGCDIIRNSNLGDTFAREPNPTESLEMSERGFGKIAKGEFLAAQEIFNQALENNPRDVYALFGKGIVLQNSGQLRQARQVFEAIVALRPSNDKKLLVINDLAPQSLQELSDLNLSLLRSQGVSSAFGSPGTPGSPGASESIGGLGAPVVNAKTLSDMIRVPAAPRRMIAKSQPRKMGVSKADRNVISRFEILKNLRDQGLVTPGEFMVRRSRNIGALIQLTAAPPAAGLTRSVPNATQISRRLKAIGRALELRAITVRQHGAERTMIIDGLMPANPVIIDKPALAPKGLMAAAEAVQRIEMLKERGLITDPEYIREKAAIEKILAPAEPLPSKSVKNTPKSGLSQQGPKSAVHLASFRSKQAAGRAWAQLRRAHNSILGKLKNEVVRVNLGRKKGVYYRLVAGPFSSAAAAATACKQLKSRRQFCGAAFMMGG
jgi:hypothetical protein